MQIFAENVSFYLTIHISRHITKTGKIQNWLQIKISYLKILICYQVLNLARFGNMARNVYCLI